MFHISGTTNLKMNLLPQQKKKERELTTQQQAFLDLLFENGGNVTQAAVDAGYSRGSAVWLRKNLADEIVERTKDVLSMNALRAANRLVATIDNPAPERGDDLRLKAAESLLNRVGAKAPEQVNHNVTAVHGVVLLPPKNEVVIDG
jgi:phage terminase small subunit